MVRSRAAEANKSQEQERARLWALLEEATVDCHDEDEQHSGLVTTIEETVECPFRAKVAGEEVTVTGFQWPNSGHGLDATCERNGREYRVDVNSLEWVKPHPQGFEWIEAFLAWRELI